MYYYISTYLPHRKTATSSEPTGPTREDHSSIALKSVVGLSDSSIGRVGSGSAGVCAAVVARPSARPSASSRARRSPSCPPCWPTPRAATTQTRRPMVETAGGRGSLAADSDDEDDDSAPPQIRALPDGAEKSAHKAQSSRAQLAASRR